MKYFIYARKSTDEANRQLLSIEAQIAELQELATKERLQVIEILTESRTAKEPGRPIFNDLLRRIENGEAAGILSWHPDRLARNSVDGGKIIYLVDTGKLQALKFSTFWFENTPQGKFMLNIAFGQSKYYVDNLSENVKRGLRQKVRRGILPGRAPLGYLNDKANHTVIPDQQKFKLVQKLFELYATGDYSLQAVSHAIAELGLVSPSGKPLAISNTQTILQNPFYYGALRFNSELYEGKHEPAITKQMYDQVQAVMQQKAKPMKKHSYFAFRGLLLCGECGGSITSERQKRHAYYRCTKKLGKCMQPYIREELLADQLKAFVQQVSIDDQLASKMSAYLKEQANKDNSSALTVTEKLEKQITESKTKLDRLLDAHLEGAIDKETYTTKKNQLLNQKIECEQKLQTFKQTCNRWLELSLQLISDANLAKKIPLTGNFEELRNFIKKIGSNLLLRERKVGLAWQNAWELLAKRACGCGARGHELDTCLGWQSWRDVIRTIVDNYLEFKFAASYIQTYFTS
ncbi:MAG: recombinase family protein [Candidatus Kerfeldbacteria bacterium]|nr:recombinase family protein [Candidatus Kerfeldbacteria bacterium]